MAYCDTSDLYKGDLPLLPAMGDGIQYVNRAADEMDTVLGQLYVTPIDLPDTPTNRPSRLWLKNCNSFIASGRLILDLALNSEDDNLHAYGLSLLNQGLEMLRAIATGAASITGAELLDPTAGAYQTGPAIYNEDSVSLVAAGYDYINANNLYPCPPFMPSQIEPYH